jgi:hypothetical protein
MGLDQEKLDTISASAQCIEHELRLPSGFICQLLEETDWGFVIKLNAIFESLLNSAITRSLLSSHRTGLNEVIAKLDMADKIAFAAQLGLVGEPDRRFLIALAELRNRLAHSVENLVFDFAAWVALMDANQRRAFARKFTGGGDSLLQEEAPGDDAKTPVDPKAFTENPKEYIFCGAMDVMDLIQRSAPQAWSQILRREATIDLNDIYEALLSDEMGDESGERNE